MTDHLNSSSSESVPKISGGVSGEQKYFAASEGRKYAACNFPLQVCPKCWHAFAHHEIHSRGSSCCPNCGKANCVEIGVPEAKAPALGVKLLCLVCAYYKPWGIWDSATGVSVCIECRDSARFAGAAQ